MSLRNLSRRAAVVTATALSGIAVAGIAYGAIADLQPASAGVDAASVAHCDSSPGSWSIAFTESGSNVTAFAVTGISANCNNTTLNWALRSGANAPVATGTTAISGGGANVTLGAALPYNAFDYEDFAILG